MCVSVEVYIPIQGLILVVEKKSPNGSEAKRERGSSRVQRDKAMVCLVWCLGFGWFLLWMCVCMRCVLCVNCVRERVKEKLRRGEWGVRGGKGVIRAGAVRGRGAWCLFVRIACWRTVWVH